MEQTPKVDRRTLKPTTFRPGMKMDPTKAKRVEVRRTSTDARPYKTFVFDCIGECGAEIKVSHGYLYKTNGLCKSCSQRKRPYEHILGFIKATSRHKGLEVTLTYEDFMALVNEGKCHYCETPLTWLRHYDGPNYKKNYFLDRKENSKGYTKDNCVPCCTTCNFIRQNKLSYDEMLLLKDGLKAVAKSRKGAATEFA